MGQYIRVGIVPVQDVLDVFTKFNLDVPHHEKANVYKEFCGKPISLDSTRYRVFSKSTSCAICGIEATYFAVEKHKALNHEKYHLNLYGTTPEGKEVLFTKGRVGNRRTTCARCIALPKHK